MKCLTKVDALRYSIAQWKRMRESGIATTSIKYDGAEPEKRSTGIDAVLCDCWLCEYALRMSKKTHSSFSIAGRCPHCPVKWPGMTDRNHVFCQQSRKSPWKKWAECPTTGDTKNDKRRVRRICSQMIKLLEDTLAKIQQ